MKKSIQPLISEIDPSMQAFSKVAQQYRTMAAHTRRCASVLVVFVVLLLAHVQVCRSDKVNVTATVE